jgi:NitT/TauT family transport system substrate-binding protein
MVGVQAWGVTAHAFVSSMAAYVGLDPAKDIDWILSPSVAPMELFAEGKLPLLNPEWVDFNH